MKLKCTETHLNVVQTERVNEQVQISALNANVKAKDNGHFSANGYVVSNVFLKWHPNLRARGFFAVNHSLIPMV